MGENQKPNYLILILAIPVYFLFSVYALTPLVYLKLQYSQANLFSNNTFDMSKISEMYKHPLESFSLLKDEPSVFKGFLIAFAVFTVIIFILFFIMKNIDMGEGQAGINYLKEDGTQGTANWMEVKEAKKILGVGTEKGLVFGSIKDGITNKMATLPPDSFFNRNVAIFGASGSMKSRSFVRPNVMQISEMEQSIIITDPKAELFESMAGFLRNKGYNVKALNLVSMINSDRWNPLNEVTDDISAQSFAETVMANTKAPGAKADEFWDKTEMNLLKALVLYVKNENPEGERNLSALYSMLALHDAATIDGVFRKLPNTHPAKMPYNIYSQASENVRTGVVIGLGSKLQVFQNKLVQDLTATSDIDLTLPKKEKCAYFCITSDMESTFDFIAGLFFSFLFIKLTKYADYAPKKGQKDVYFILDEFPNIGAIPDFTKKISTMRSRGISSCVIFQNIAQLKNRYPNDAWSEIIGNCDSRLFLGATDIITAEFVSKLLGTATVKDTSLSKSAGLEGLVDFGKITSRTTKRNLMNPDEILRLPNKNSLLILKGQKPLKLEKMDYTKHRLSKDINPILVSDYKPEWTKGYYDNKKNIYEKEISPEDTVKETTTEEIPNRLPSVSKMEDTDKVTDNEKELYSNDKPEKINFSFHNEEINSKHLKTNKSSNFQNNKVENNTETKSQKKKSDFW